MIDIQYLIYFNNVVCTIALATCFLHALHGGMEKSYVTKVTLFIIGLGFYSSIVSDRTKLLVPGHEYSMVLTIVFSLSMIAIFVHSYYKHGYLTHWVQVLSSALHLTSKREDSPNAQAKK